MRYADVNGVKSEAQPKMQAVCRACGGELVAKCGKHVIWHWSHLSLDTCDRWWETETEWHRRWKDRFPKDCQEVIQYDALTGEKHISDVRTEHGVVVEFQRSTIDHSEVKARESFY
ncbi:competence protein CoiA family protein [Pseudomonas sp. St386]|uniref:competence protein CoiA n=1 Tax=Pseudomonas sp. St386 TaxID=2678256 RepID=UPI001FD205F1|nr:competence protein CoiA family protein [Pseudomonas sp. St386]